VNGPHKFVEKPCFNENLGEHAKDDKNYNKKTCCKKEENNATISDHKKTLANNALITNLILPNNFLKRLVFYIANRYQLLSSIKNPWLKHLLLHQCGCVQFPFQ
jgi:hypothetical protein